MFGTFRDDHPRMMLILPGREGEIEVEFIVDTGFAGDLALPAYLINQIEGTLIDSRDRMLATGQQFRCPSYEILLDWNDEPRPTEVLILGGDPLLGTVILREHLHQVEMIEGGEVSVGPL